MQLDRFSDRLTDEVPELLEVLEKKLPTCAASSELITELNPVTIPTLEKVTRLDAVMRPRPASC